MKDKITAIILTKNEQDRIEECIKSVSWVDEIIIVDNGSSDKTIDVARKFTPHIIRSETRNFASLRNLGLAHAHGEWVLYLDADERATEALQKKIEKIIRSYGPSSPGAYYIQRRNYYLGALWPTQDKMHRFFRKDALIKWQGELHETALVKGKVETIGEPLVHMTHRTLEEMVSKTNEWSKIEAQLRLSAGHPKIVPWRLLRVFLTSFLGTYFQGGGWRAGTVGMIESLYQGFSLFITYAKLWELQQKK